MTDLSTFDIALDNARTDYQTADTHLIRANEISDEAEAERDEALCTYADTSSAYHYARLARATHLFAQAVDELHAANIGEIYAMADDICPVCMEGPDLCDDAHGPHSADGLMYALINDYRHGTNKTGELVADWLCR